MTWSWGHRNHKDAVGWLDLYPESSLSSTVVSFTTADELMPTKQLIEPMNDDNQPPLNDQFDDFCFDNDQILGPSCISRAASTSSPPQSLVSQRISSLRPKKKALVLNRSNHQHCNSESSYESQKTNRSSSQTTSTSRTSKSSTQRVYLKDTPPVSMSAHTSIDSVSKNEARKNSKLAYMPLTPKSSWSFPDDKTTNYTAHDESQKQNFSQESETKETQNEALALSNNEQSPTNCSFTSIAPSVQNSDPEITKSLEKLRKKQNAARELFFTERQFAQDMAVIVRIYMCGSAGIGLSMRQIDTLFSNVTHVLDLSLSIVATLETQIPAQILQNDVSLGPMDIEADKELLVGKAMCLVLNGQFYQVYEEYIHNNPTQMSLCYHLTKDLAKLQSGKAKSGDLAHVDREQLAAWLQRSNQRAEKFTTAWSLDSLLIKPIQRLGKYPLLLKTMLQYTDSSHDDYEYLQKALKRSIQYLDCVNARFGVV